MATSRLAIAFTLSFTLLNLGCTGGRSMADLTDEAAQLEKKIAALSTDQARSDQELADLQARLDAARALGDQARSALALRDQLRAKLASLGSTDETSATVADVAGGQVRRPAEASEEGYARATPGSPAAPRPANGDVADYRGPVEIHVVVKGESLWAIAGYPQYYGDGNRWPTIYQANSRQIKDPHWIFVGQRLSIPAE